MSKILLGLFFSVVTFAIEVNQSIELTQYMNARYTSRFTKADENVAGSLATGTQGTVREIKTFNSGNSGFLIQVKDGEFKNQKLWVYYNKDAPTLKLVDEKQQPTTVATQADRVVASAPTPVRVIPVTPKAVVGQIDQVHDELAKLNSELQAATPSCKDCAPDSPGQAGGLPESNLEIATSQTAAGLFNAKIKCSYRSDQGMTLAGAIQLEIVGNKVKNLNATVNGCSVNLKKFKQVTMPNTNIVLTDANGCSVVIANNLKIKTPASTPVLTFGMVPTTDCVKSCAKVERAHWQVEMNPNTQTCY